MNEENKNLESSKLDQEKVKKINSDENFWDSMHNVYDDIDVDEDKYSSDDDIIFDEEVRKEIPPMEDRQVIPEAKENTTLHDLIATKSAVSTFDTVMSTLGSMTYNMFAKDHKCSPSDWALNQAQADGMMPVMELLLKHIEVKSESPYLAFAGVCVAIYGSKAGQIRSHYKQGTDLGKEANYSRMKGSSKSSGAGANYVRKWIGSKTDGIPNPEHSYWKNNPEEFATYKKD